VGEQGCIDHIGIAERYGSWANKVPVQPFIVVKKSHTLKASTQTANGWSRNSQAFCKLTVRMRPWITNKALQDHQPLGERTGKVGVIRAHTSQILLVFDLMNGTFLSHAGILAGSAPVCTSQFQ
jgi:hypothetical protein